MKRTWTIIGVSDVVSSLKWYQALFGQPAVPPSHAYFGQIFDSDGTVLLCLHAWGAHEHPSLMSPDQERPGNGLLLFSVSMISIRRSKGHDLSPLVSKTSQLRIRTLKPRNSRSGIQTDITLRSVRSLRSDKTLQFTKTLRGFHRATPPDFAALNWR
jgi:hypothetical protein